MASTLHVHSWVVYTRERTIAYRLLAYSTRCNHFRSMDALAQTPLHGGHSPVPAGRAYFI